MIFVHDIAIAIVHGHARTQAKITNPTHDLHDADNCMLATRPPPPRNTNCLDLELHHCARMPSATRAATIIITSVDDNRLVACVERETGRFLRQARLSSVGQTHVDNHDSMPTQNVPQQIISALHSPCCRPPAQESAHQLCTTQLVHVASRAQFLHMLHVKLVLVQMWKANWETYGTR